MKTTRIRLHYVAFIGITIAFGLFSRSSFIPEVIYPYIGDILYATMFFFIFGFLLPQKSSINIALLAIGTCYLIEISQLYQAEWINQIRSYKLGGLVLGFGFLWSDLVSYALGGFLGFTIEKLIILDRLPSK